jgi:hypothetical protein
LLQGDKGFNVLDLFELLTNSELELIDMVNWQSWQVLDLIKNQAQMPEYLEMLLSVATPSHIYTCLSCSTQFIALWIFGVDIRAQFRN